MESMEIYDKIFCGLKSEFTDEFARILFKNFNKTEKLDFLIRFGSFWIPNEINKELMKDEFFRVHYFYLNQGMYLTDELDKILFEPSTELELALENMNAFMIGMHINSKRHSGHQIKEMEWDGLIRNFEFFKQIQKIIKPDDMDIDNYFTTTCQLDESKKWEIFNNFICYWFVNDINNTPRSMQLDPHQISDVWEYVLSLNEIDFENLNRYEEGTEPHGYSVYYLFKNGPIPDYKLISILNSIDTNANSSKILAKSLNQIGHPLFFEGGKGQEYLNIWQKKTGEFNESKFKAISKKIRKIMELIDV